MTLAGPAKADASGTNATARLSTPATNRPKRKSGINNSPKRAPKPGNGLVLPGADSAAFATLSGLPIANGSWTDVTNRPYNADDPRYRDPFASNSGAGNGLASGGIVGIAVGGGDIYIGGANGGVFRSADDGMTWTPMTDALPTLSVGDIRIAPDGALWLATGEANTASRAYVGTGVYRLTNPKNGAFTTADRVGGMELESTFIGKLRFDGIDTCTRQPRALCGSTRRTRTLLRGHACCTRCPTPRIRRGSRPITTSATTPIRIKAHWVACTSRRPAIRRAPGTRSVAPASCRRRDRR
jgi:hypothetical protein